MQGNKVLDLVSSHAATATFLTEKIYKHIFSEKPPAAVLVRARAAWVANDGKPGQITQVLRAILLDGSEIGDGPRTKVRRPYERMIALARVTDAQVEPDPLYTDILNAVTDTPFGWATPDGRPDDNKFWLNTSTNIGVWNQLLYVTYSTYISIDYLTQTPLDIQKSAILTTEYWVGRMIGYRLSDEAMAALATAVARLFEGYSSSPFYREAFGTKFISQLATAPEFVYH